MPFSTYSAWGALRQGPGHAADSADVTPLTTSAFNLPDHLSPKADPSLIAGDQQHFA
ncbi:MAG: hypothetical protein QOC85_1234, partial [Streptomyces sp.]|nr:hypothetical protein [Streptomyces sp.]